MNGPTILLNINDLSVSYDGNKNVLNHISFHVKKGEFISLIGSSGCGKSTLLNGIAGFITPSTGNILVNENIVKKPGPDRGVVFQDLALFPWLNVIENVAFGLKLRGMNKTERLERSADVIRLVSLQGYEYAKVSDLSGGMKQRVAIARTIVTEPEILLMDEPFSALDAQTRELLQDELMRIQEQTGMTVILVTHSIDEAVYLSDRVLILQKETGKIQNMLDITLRRPRHPDNRVDLSFNEFKKQLMLELRKD
ncbi:ABC transporter ATP-binding protein [Paenibacillus sp. sgz302251]|uniref:ABC transporter ATP-binding protein n=1 Tax=Paenibacillus sp. sgz302251 TaxID=3414493 RepID=UPI003C7E9A71